MPSGEPPSRSGAILSVGLSGGVGQKERPLDGAALGIGGRVVRLKERGAPAKALPSLPRTGH